MRNQRGDQFLAIAAGPPGVEECFLLLRAEPAQIGIAGEDIAHDLLRLVGGGVVEEDQLVIDPAGGELEQVLMDQVVDVRAGRHVAVEFQRLGRFRPAQRLGPGVEAEIGLPGLQPDEAFIEARLDPFRFELARHHEIVAGRRQLARLEGLRVGALEIKMPVDRRDA